MSDPNANRIAPCWEQWSYDQDIEATFAFQLDAAGNPRRYTHLYDRLDYLDAYCSAANRAMDVEPTEESGLSWWERSWLGRLLRR